MPLLDVNWAETGRDPQTFLSHWSTSVVDDVTYELPEPAARFQVNAASRTRAKTAATIREFAGDTQGPPFGPPALVAPARYTDRVGVNVIENGQVAAAVMFVTADNKIDSDGSLAFAVRAAGLMAVGVGVVIVDVLPGPPSWAPHLHSLVGVCPIARRARRGECTILAVHPRMREGEQYDVWSHLIEVGGKLPTVPLLIRGTANLKLDLETTYKEACERCGVA